MKRRLLSILLVLILLLNMTLAVSAATPRIMLVSVDLGFVGTTAQCGVSVSTDYLTDSIYSTIKLYRNGRCIKTWTKSSFGMLSFYEEVSAIRNSEYTLEAVVTVNGVTEPVCSKTKTCE